MSKNRTPTHNSRAAQPPTTRPHATAQTPTPPPAYRPQPVPKVLQAKAHAGRAAAAPAARPPTPNHLRAPAVQAKPARPVNVQTRNAPAPPARGGVIQRAAEAPAKAPAKKKKQSLGAFLASGPIAPKPSAWNSSFLKSEDDDKSQAEHFPPPPGASAAAAAASPVVHVALPSAAAKWKAKPMALPPPPPPPDPLAGIKAKIMAWNRSVHAGTKEALSEAQIATLTSWAEGVLSHAGNTTAFSVLRGAGSGDYAGSDQLKIISKHYPAISGKQPTYHVTLKD